MINLKENLRALIIFSQPWRIGGAETHLLTLVKELIRLGKYIVIVGIDDSIKEAFRGLPVYVLPLRNLKPFTFINNLASIKAIIDKEKINIIHCYQRTATVYAKILKDKSSIPYIATIHDRWRPLHIFYRPFLPQSCIAISAGIKIHITAKLGIPEERIHVIPNGVSLNFVGLKNESSNPSVIYISRLNRVKAQVAIELCHVVKLLRTRIPSVTLTIVGDGPYIADVAKCADVINSSLNDQIITLLGARNDVPELVGNHDVVVGVGRVALEAMAAQKPVVAVADLENFPGLITPANWQKASTTSWTRGEEKVTVENISKELEKVLLNPTLKRELGLFGQNLVKHKFSAKTMALSTIKIYEDVVAESNPCDVYHKDVSMLGY